MTREQLENEIALFNHIVADPRLDPCAIEDAYNRLAVALLQWMDYAEGLRDSLDQFRRLCDRIQALNNRAVAENGELILKLEKAIEDNRILLRAMTHAGGVAAKVEQRRGGAVARCREVG